MSPVRTMSSITSLPWARHPPCALKSRLDAGSAAAPDWAAARELPHALESLGLQALSAGTVCRVVPKLSRARSAARGNSF